MSDKVKRIEAVIPDDLLAAMLVALPVTAPSSRRRTAMRKSLLSCVDKVVGEKAVEAAKPEMFLDRKSVV